MAKMPMNPLAGPSGPGKYSTRPDQLNMGSIAYGEGKETKDIKQGARLAQTPDVSGAPASQIRAAARRPVQVGTRLYDASTRPDEDIMSGAPIGPGPGPEALGFNTPSADTDTDKQRLLSYLPALEVIAQSPSSSESFRNYVRVLRSELL